MYIPYWSPLISTPPHDNSPCITLSMHFCGERPDAFQQLYVIKFSLLIRTELYGSI